MASPLLYFGLSFTIILNCAVAYDSKIEAGVSLVTGPDIVLVQQKIRTAVLLDCSLNVTDKSLLPLSYKWLKDGRHIDPLNTKSKVQLLLNGSLLLQPRRIRGRNRTYDGLYSCLVTTATKGVIIARRIKVLVASMAKNFTKEPVSQEVFKGGVARFECSIQAEPMASYIWHRNDTQLPQDDDRFTSLPSGILQISKVDLNDAGHYWCQATTYLFTTQKQITNFSWKTSRRVELRVRTESGIRPPTLLASPQNISVLAGQTAEFECFAEGNPAPTIVWKKKDSDITFGSQAVDKNGNLHLAQVVSEDAGIYECTVSSRGRYIKALATLIVLEPPKLEQGPDSNLYPVARAMTTSCKVTGNPPPKISWYHNGTPISEADVYSETKDIKNGQTLYLYTLQKKNSGFYQCLAENSVGQVMTVALLKIILTPEAPLPPRHVKCSPLSSTSFLVTWDHTPTGSHPYVVSYQIVGDTNPPTQVFCYARINETKQQCEISNQITPFTNYSVRVQAYNVKGASDITDKVYVQTLEDLPNGVPLLTVSSPHFHSMLVSWAPLTPDLSRGRVIAYKVHYRSAEKREEMSREVGANQTFYLITGVEPEKVYEVLVIAATSVGFTKTDHWPWTRYMTPPANVSSSPRLDMKYVNTSALLLEWQSPVASADQNITGYCLELRSLSRLSEPAQRFLLASSAQSYVLTGLDSEQFYEVTLTANTSAGMYSPSAREFQLTEMQAQLVPSDFCVTSVYPDTISLTWTAVPGVDVQYEVCYRREQDKSEWICEVSNETAITLSDLESFTRYEFIVRVMMGMLRAANSKTLIVQTTEDKPSPPINLTVEVKQNSVKLHWLPPTQPNGVITYYIIMYGRDSVQNSNVIWKSITYKGTDTSAQLDDLESDRYLFKIVAGNKAGHSPDTDIVAAIPICKTHIGTSCPLVTENMKDGLIVVGTPGSSVASSLSDIQIGIIIGCLTGFVCLLVLVMVVRKFFYRSLAREHGSSTGNGHIPTLSGLSNGHVHFITSSNGNGMFRTHESTPMLKQIPENEHSDSKGGPNMLNGFYINGVVKGNHKFIGHTLQSEDMNSASLKDLQGLKAAVLALADRSEMLGREFGEKIPMLSLDDIDRGDESLAERRKRDSSNGYKHAIKNITPNLVNSADHCSLEENQRRYQGSEIDVYLKSSTGNIITEVSSYAEEDCQDENTSRERTEGSISNDSGQGSDTKSCDGTCSSTSDVADASHSYTLDISAFTPLPDVQVRPAAPSSASESSSSQQLPPSTSKNCSRSHKPQTDHYQHQDEHTSAHLSFSSPPSCLTNHTTITSFTGSSPNSSSCEAHRQQQPEHC